MNIIVIGINTGFLLRGLGDDRHMDFTKGGITLHLYMYDILQCAKYLYVSLLMFFLMVSVFKGKAAY